MIHMKSQHWLMSIVALAVLATSILAGCKKDKSEDPTPGDAVTFDRSGLLTDFTNNVVLPGYADLVTTSDALHQAAATFADTPEMGTLTALRAAWNTTMEAWMACEMFRFGPQYTDNLNQRIAYAAVNNGLIENEIAGSGPIDASYIANTGVTRKGLYALEYLLYNGDETTVLNAFTTGANAERRRIYVVSLSTDIATRITAIRTAWTDGGYAGSFIAATQSNINGSLNILVNAWIEHIELVRRDKVQLPSGIEAGGTPNPEAVENRLSGRSIANIRIAAEQWQRIFTSGGSGLDDNLNAINAQYQGEPLALKIRQEVDASIAACDAITVPLDDAVNSQQTQVNDLFLALKRLTVLTKVDMASQLGVIITFSDNDGD